MKARNSGIYAVTLFWLLLSVAPGYAQAQISALYNFNNSSDPSGFINPGTLSQGLDGNIYSTSFTGGVSVGGKSPSGTFFSMNPIGALAELYSFQFVQSEPGCSPSSGVTLGTDGNFYGSAEGCGSFFDGTLFAMTPSGIPTGLHNFGGNDGQDPAAAPVEGTDGNYYGTTLGGGSANCGTIYQITPAGSLTTLYQFDGTHGCNSFGPLVLATDGNLYGTAESGGTNKFGVVFKITTLGQYTVLYNFDGTHGKNPLAPLTQARGGAFFGTALSGGQFDSGVVFRIDPSGKFRVLHNFDPASGDGGAPVAGVVQATDGNLYGLTQAGGSSFDGVAFRISSNGGYSLLASFDASTGALPLVTLLQHTNGLLYGLADAGGAYSAGTFYSLNVGLKPFVSLVSFLGPVGTTIGILGQGFTGTKKVTFGGGSAAAFTVVSDTYLTATVPTGALTGFVAVRTPSGILKSNRKFIVSP